jgi:hypothetical protein
MHDIPLYSLNRQWWIAYLGAKWSKEAISTDGTSEIGASSPIRVTVPMQFKRRSSNKEHTLSKCAL